MTLFDQHSTSSLGRYRQNLEFLLAIAERGDIPEAEDTVVQPLVDELRRHMAAAGTPETDDFLLRFGLTVPGAMKGIKPPLAVLAPGRGGFSEARIRMSAAQVGRLREALDLARWCFGDLGPDTFSQLRAIVARLVALPDSSGTVWVEAHAGLPDDEAAKLVERAIQCLDAPGTPLQELGLGILCSLAAFREGGLGEATFELWRRGIFSPPNLYLDAPEAVGEEIIASLGGAQEQLSLNHRLLALAWTRGEAARRAFAQWLRVPPAWGPSLHVPAEDYLPSAGWTLDAAGQRRDLIATPCYRFASEVDAPADASEAGPEVPCRVSLAERCPACGGDLRWLFDFSQLPESFFSGGRAEAPRRVLACLGCALYCTVFTRYLPDGGAEWHPATECEETDRVDLGPAVTLRLLWRPQPPFAAAEPFRIADATSLGGVPMWVQDAEYPRCPDCRDLMAFLAQLDNSSLPQAEEGIFYSFFCAHCRTAAVSYQQT